ncbi:MAG TPA: alanyl-tRNA editing protein [Solirubrobacteraceae bacterium]
MTIRLYWDDPYLKTAFARVVAVEGRAIVLDATVFHARGGGQPGDTGTLGADVVIDTYNGPDGRVLHLADGVPSTRAGQRVSSTIDWDRRYGLMRHHTLLHLLHLVLNDAVGPVEPLGSAVAADKARIEYPLHRTVDLDAISAGICELVADDLAATAEFGGDGVRRWSIPGQQPIPCGGTHVARLGELGHISLRAKSAGRRGLRLYATCELRPGGQGTAT